MCWKATGLFLLSFLASVVAQVQITFPINSQVPPVARVLEEYNFAFSASTFSSVTGSPIAYSLANAPDWLRLDSDTRTLSGTPARSDTGSPEFDIVATDGSGPVTLQSTLIVTSDSGIGLGEEVSTQLEAFGPTSGLGTLDLYPLQSFAFSFSPQTFIGTTQKTIFYATSADDTPLPSWITFDPSALRFSGTAPFSGSSISPPISFSMRLVASDYAGFAGASVFFTLVVGIHTFAFDPDYLSLNVTSGVPFDITNLQNTLKLDGKVVNDQQISQIRTNIPSWVSFDRESISLSGTPPQNVQSDNASISVVDVYGNTANISVNLKVADNLLLGGIGSINASIGTSFQYTISRSLLMNPLETVNMDLTAVSGWMSFDQATLELSGQVPEDLSPGKVSISLTAALGSKTQTQPITVNIIRAPHSSATTSSTLIPSMTSSTVITPTATASGGGTRLSNMQIRLIIGLVFAIIGLLGLIAVIVFCCHRRRKTKEQNRQLNVAKREIISDPVVQEAPPSDAEAGRTGTSDGDEHQLIRPPSQAPKLHLRSSWKESSFDILKRNKRVSRITEGTESGDDGKGTSSTVNVKTGGDRSSSFYPPVGFGGIDVLRERESSPGKSQRSNFSRKRVPLRDIQPKSPDPGDAGLGKRASILSHKRSGSGISRRKSGAGLGTSGSLRNSKMFKIRPDTEASWESWRSTELANLSNLGFPQPPSGTAGAAGRPNEHSDKSTIRRVNDENSLEPPSLVQFHRTRRRDPHPSPLFSTGPHDSRASSRSFIESRMAKSPNFKNPPLPLDRIESRTPSDMSRWPSGRSRSYSRSSSLGPSILEVPRKRGDNTGLGISSRIVDGLRSHTASTQASGSSRFRDTDYESQTESDVDPTLQVQEGPFGERRWQLGTVGGNYSTPEPAEEPKRRSAVLRDYSEDGMPVEPSSKQSPTGSNFRLGEARVGRPVSIDAELVALRGRSQKGETAFL